MKTISKNLTGRTGRFMRSEAPAAIFFLTPALIIWIWWTFIPLCKSIQYCLYEFNYAVPQNTRFVGLGNFVKLFHDKTFLTAVKHSLQIAVVCIPVIICTSLVLSVLLNKKIRFRGFFRTAFYFPYILSSVAVTIVFMGLLVQGSFIPTICSKLFGIANVTWTTDTRYALMAVMLIYIFQQIGFYVVVFLAGLQDIPHEIIESARIDGANALQEFLHITLPMLKPVISMQIIMCTIISFKIFDQISAISRGTVLGAPAGATNTAVTFFYTNAFRYGDMGYASAAAMILFGVILLASALFALVFRSRKA